MLTCFLLALAGCGGGFAGSDCTTSGCARGETCSATTGVCEALTADGGTRTCASTDTWAGYAGGFFSANCSGCHGGVYDSASGVAANKSAIASSITAGRMPRGGGLSSTDRSRILAWLACQ